MRPHRGSQAGTPVPSGVVSLAFNRCFPKFNRSVRTGVEFPRNERAVLSSGSEMRSS
jgi:hypothetical protein